LNAAGLVRGLLDPPLDDVGRTQAQEVARALSRLPVGEVVAGPLRRTIQTAQPIAYASQVPLEVDVRLQDRDYGEWAGQRVEAVVAQWGSLDNAPGVEPLSTVTRRAREALEDYADRSTSDLMVVVTHDAVIRALVTTWRHVDEGVRSFTVDPASYSVVERRGGDWRVLSVNNRVD
jgi:broad specificity phosphatase PhoE